jgi:hypothetical protein
MRKLVPVLLLIPLLLTGCTADPEPIPKPVPVIVDGNVENEIVDDGGTRRPNYAPISNDTKAWAEYRAVGAKLPSEDPDVRAVNSEEFATYTDPADTMRVQGEVTADTEATATSITAWLEQNPDAKTLDGLPQGVIVNRYPELVELKTAKLSTGDYEVYLTNKEPVGISGYAVTTVK